MLKFRNIEATPQDPVEEWGTEGILTALDRGTVRHWAQIVQAAKDPESAVAQELAEALQMSNRRPAVIWVNEQLKIKRATPESRVAQQLKIMLIQSGLNQSEFAEALGTSSSRMSTYLSAKVTPNAAFMIRAQDLVDETARDVLKKIKNLKSAS